MSVYCDHNATTPLRREAFAAMRPWLEEEYGNPSSSHAAGSRARCAVEEARADVAALIGCSASNVVFTSGGTESNDAALRGCVRASADTGASRQRVLTTAIEHASVLACLSDIAGLEVQELAVDANGRVDLALLSKLLERPTSLVSVGWANNEIGTIQPVAEIAEICRRAGVRFHSDAVQAAGKIDIDVRAVDLASVSAHKIGGPKGVGALFVRADCAWRPMLRGGSQERERRAGTENVAGIVGFGCAARRALAERADNAARWAQWRDELWELLQPVGGVHRHGSRDAALPHTLNVRFDGVRGESLVAALDMEGIAVSTGSACAAGAAEPSHVLIAIGVPAAQAGDGIRFSFGAASSPSDPQTIARATVSAVARIRSIPPQRAVA